MERDKNMRDLIQIVAQQEPLYEMAGLPPQQTGLPFSVWVSPKGGAKHSARIKVTTPPYGSHPEAVYQILPFGFINDKLWLNANQEKQLAVWVELNEKPLLDFWEGRIHYDDDLRAKLITVNDAPPGNHREAIVALRASAPKVKSIWWHDGAYNLFFDRFLPDATKVEEKFAALGFVQPIRLHKIGKETGILLYPRSNI